MVLFDRFVPLRESGTAIAFEDDSPNFGIWIETGRVNLLFFAFCYPSLVLAMIVHWFNQLFGIPLWITSTRFVSCLLCGRYAGFRLVPPTTTSGKI